MSQSMSHRTLIWLAVPPILDSQSDGPYFADVHRACNWYDFNVSSRNLASRIAECGLVRLRLEVSSLKRR